ncbi:MAG: PaaI family thioesterase [Hyphomicrobiaceae bacterium]
MSTVTPSPKHLSAETVTELIDDAFPQIHAAGRVMEIEDIGTDTARVRMRLNDRNTRPGGTISGPAMFTLADFSIYAALIGRLGPPAIPAVTSNLNITFLMRPPPRDVIAETRLVRVGRRLAYAEVALYSDGGSEMIAHATGTYALAKQVDAQ